MDHSEGQAKYDRVLELCSNDFTLDSANGDLPPLNEQHLSRMRQIIQNAMAVATLEVLQETSPPRQPRILVKAGTKRSRDDNSDAAGNSPSSTPATLSPRQQSLFGRPSRFPEASFSQIGAVGPLPTPGAFGPPSHESRTISCTADQIAENNLAPGGENCSTRKDPARVLPATHNTGIAEHVQANGSSSDILGKMPSGNLGTEETYPFTLGPGNLDNTMCQTVDPIDLFGDSWADHNSNYGFSNDDAS